MAGPTSLKRKRAPISYREDSTDDSSAVTSEDEFVEERRPAPAKRSSNRHSAQQHPKAARSRRKCIISYKEASSDEDSNDCHEEKEALLTPTTKRPRTKHSPISNAGISKMPRRRRPRRRGILGGPVKAPSSKVSSTTTTECFITDGHIPDWSSLPYHVLLQIFVYASHPLCDGNSVPGVPWLLNMARICANFTKPALTALYRNPPISALEKTRKNKLVQHLLEPATRNKEDYKVMVRRLELDATRMSALTAPGRSDKDLAALILNLTTLKEIDIFDPLDRPPYRRRPKSVRWHYPDGLFTALHESELHLKSWRWNSSLTSKNYFWMKEIHGDRAFQNLQELMLTNYSQGPVLQEDDQHPTAEELLASAVAVLSRLKSLVFESSTIVNKRLLPLLPQNLVNLNITNCGSITSDALQDFLVTHGTHLEELVLNHNQALDISFLPNLKGSCPRLETLRMDLNYYNHFATYQDSDPKYADLLKEHEIPSWPSTLRSIEMVYLRKWTAAAAKTFFESLIDSAEELPDLRELVLKAMVDTNWRERAAFRDEWIARLRRVFLRNCPPPNPHLVSLRAFREWKESQISVTGDETPHNEVASDDGSVAGPSRVAASSNKGNIVQDSDSDVPILYHRRHMRRRKVATYVCIPKPKQTETWGSPQRLRARGKASGSQIEMASGDETEGSKNVVGEQYIQGRCRVVDVRIDNLRPREELFSENDFLDSEVSGDEDWNGNDDIDIDGAVYAW
ncbi:hypothetical protein K432DRAFT_357388 [Lepidopterella palustris CBS 459.81]|uniref:Uncharacterized protein n=1 Tax=Lepidopterella palustris CBS 459.81 TaxID=1314670 RepID=A0A8E2E698_9PEZI|nr:hypothetical protein K432DRAFT_357388 [Lepidopterella palustris CBS 459.81]